jgi:thiol-disulfide isomerase/thioredoxin
MPRFLPTAALLCVLLAACTSSSTEAVGDGAFVAGRGTQGIPVAERAAAPELTAETLDGDSVSLAALDGPVVVNFWASWCGPCIQEAPDLAEAYARYRDQGVHFIGVNVRDSPTNARRFEADLGIPYPSWYDDTGLIAQSFGGVGPGAMPSTIILDAEHRVAARLFGAVTFPTLRGYLDDLLAEGPRAGGEAG